MQILMNFDYRTKHTL